jgi:lipopolysaccharide export system ATP-binding protein
MAGSVLVADAITVHLAGRVIVREVSLAVGAGEVLGLFGPSGAGKSTLFRALAGELVPSRGRVVLGDEDVTRLPLWQRARRGLGYLPQTPSVLFDLTVAENLAVFYSLAPTAARTGLAQAEMAGELGLSELLDVPAGSLSGGERRRLELARALCVRPRVLLCDEPFAAIDPIGARRVSDRLRRIAGEGSSVIVADHHVSEALRLCDRAALLVEGEVALVTSSSEFPGHELVRRHYALM